MKDYKKLYEEVNAMFEIACEELTEYGCPDDETSESCPLNIWSICEKEDEKINQCWREYFKKRLEKEAKND